MDIKELFTKIEEDFQALFDNNLQLYIYTIEDLNWEIISQGYCVSQIFSDEPSEIYNNAS